MRLALLAIFASATISAASAPPLPTAPLRLEPSALTTRHSALPPTSPAPAPKRPWTIMVYAAVDNSADDPLVEFMDKVRKAVDNDPGINLLLFIDRAARHQQKQTYLGDDFQGARLYHLTKDSAERLGGGSQLPEITLDKDVEVDSADAKYVQQFIAWGKANYPADRYGLLIYSHADGHAMCPDDQSHHEMGFAELTEKATSAERVDFMGLELCNMGGIEIAYQWRPGNGGFETDVLLAIPNAGPPLDWDRAFRRIRTQPSDNPDASYLDPRTMTAADFGKLIIEKGHMGRKDAQHAGRNVAHEAAACYDLTKAAEVKKAIDALSGTLATPQARDTVLKLRGERETQGGCIAYTGDRTYVDVHDLCERISGCEQLSDNARVAAKKVMAAVDEMILNSFGMSAYEGFEPGKNGVFIVLPTDAKRFAKDLSWYSPDETKDKALGRLAFLRDGAAGDGGGVGNWFELLGGWFGK